MKRIGMLILAVFLLLSGCNQKEPDDKISVVCTIFPQYDWSRQILGDNADNIELTLLLDKKIDLHSYQPSVADIAKASSCDLFIYVGGESDEWVGDLLKEASNKDMVAINLLDALGDLAKETEITQGMEAEEHSHEEDSHDHNAEADEHVWLSLKNAQMLCTVIADALSELDSGNAEVYRSNLAAYNKELSALDAEYQRAVDSAPVEVLLFGDRFPFRYLTDDYGLDYYAAFAGCSAETEAGFHTVVFLAGKADELGLKSIMVTESSDQSIAKTVIDNSADKNRRILVLNSMQSVTSDEASGGISYISIMENNLGVLKDALN